MRNLATFRLGSVIKKLNRITVAINTTHCRPFPKPHCMLLSHYRHQRRYISVHSDGSIPGGLPHLVSSLIDFSFIRSLVAHRYHLLGAAYDPVSIFLIDLFRYLDKFPDMKTFVTALRDPHRGKHYRLYALRGVGPTGRTPASTTNPFPARLLFQT